MIWLIYWNICQFIFFQSTNESLIPFKESVYNMFAYILWTAFRVNTSSYISTFTQFFCCVHFISSWVLLWSCSALYTQGQDQGFIVGECSYTWLNMACLKGWSLTHLFRGDLPSWKQIHCTYSLALNVFSGSKLWPLHLSPSSVVSFGSSIAIAAAGFLWHD